MKLYFCLSLIWLTVATFLPAPRLPSRYHKQVGAIGAAGRYIWAVRVEVGVRRL